MTDRCQQTLFVADCGECGWRSPEVKLGSAEADGVVGMLIEHQRAAHDTHLDFEPTLRALLVANGFGALVAAANAAVARRFAR